VSAVDRVVVVVPAHDEEAVLERCLAHLEAAVDAVAGGVAVRTVVVLDGCTDGSAAIARRHRVEVVGCTARMVGRARAVGVATGAGGVRRPERCWVATTDADSRVPEAWLVDQVAAAAQGADLVVGRVLPDPDELRPDLLARWLTLHPIGGRHVHGANLGVRLSAYRAAGGFPPLPVGEDEALVAAVRAAGGVVVGGGEPVVTSARTTARAPDGFAAYLRRLAAPVAPVPSP
jgi:glycosyltransferase involved in cell wall biosynthesis